MQVDRRRPRLHAVSGLRYLAALHLIVYHLALLGFLDAAALAVPLRAVVRAGYTTTGLFLVLSGFMLYYGYVDADGRLRTPARRLWWARFAMLYPLAVIGQLVGLPGALAGAETMGGGEIAARLATSLTLTQAWVPSVAFSFDGPAWTLSCLAAFYLVFPWLAVRVARLPRGMTIAALLGTWVVAQGLVGAAFLVRPDLVGVAGTDSHDALAVALHVSPLARVWEFASGVLLARLLLGPWARQEGAAAAAPRPWRSPDLALLAVLAALVVLEGRIPFNLLHNGAILPLQWLLIASLVAGGGVLARVLASRPVVALGEASLPIFLLHVPALHYVRYAVGRGWLADGPVLCALLVAGITAGSYLVATRGVQPLAARLRAWGDARFLPATASPAPAPAPARVAA